MRTQVPVGPGRPNLDRGAARAWLKGPLGESQGKKETFLSRRLLLARVTSMLLAETSWSLRATGCPWVAPSTMRPEAIPQRGRPALRPCSCSRRDGTCLTTATRQLHLMSPGWAVKVPRPFHRVAESESC